MMELLFRCRELTTKTTGLKQDGGMLAPGVSWAFSLSDNVFFSAVNEQRKRLDRNKMATGQQLE